MNKLTLTTTLMTGLMTITAATPALAGRDGTVYAEVVSSRPLYTQVQISEPERVCRDERVVYREPARVSSNPAGTILGGIIGGVIGHQFGGGHGRDVATAAGAVVGAGIGSQSGNQYQGPSERVSYEQRCDVVNHYRTEQRVDGYDVTYNYGGQLYNTRLPYDPGRRIAVNVNVQPVRY